MMDSQVKLKSNDGLEINLPKQNALLSNLIKNAIEDISNCEEALSIMEVDGKTLTLVVEYLNHFNGVPPSEIEKPLKSSVLKEIIDEWSADFIEKFDVEVLVDLTVAANYMEIQCLLDLVCAKLASMCKDKSEEEIFSTFGVKEPFTEEEKTKIKEENKWIEENL